MCYLLATQDILDGTQKVTRSCLLDRMRIARQRLEKEQGSNLVASAVSKQVPSLPLSFLLSSQPLPASPTCYRFRKRKGMAGGTEQPSEASIESTLCLIILEITYFKILDSPTVNIVFSPT